MMSCGGGCTGGSSVLDLLCGKFVLKKVSVSNDELQVNMDVEHGER